METEVINNEYDTLKNEVVDTGYWYLREEAMANTNAELVKLLERHGARCVNFVLFDGTKQAEFSFRFNNDTFQFEEESGFPQLNQQCLYTYHKGVYCLPDPKIDGKNWMQVNQLMKQKLGNDDTKVALLDLRQLRSLFRQSIGQLRRRRKPRSNQQKRRNNMSSRHCRSSRRKPVNNRKRRRNKRSWHLLPRLLCRPELLLLLQF